MLETAEAADASLTPGSATQSRLAQGHPHALPGRSLPTSPPCITEGMGDITAASTVAATHRPRGIIRLLPEGVEGSGDDHPSIERVIVEEYILDTLHWCAAALHIF